MMPEGIGVCSVGVCRNQPAGAWNAGL